jgi:hypothetical protein
MPEIRIRILIIIMLIISDIPIPAIMKSEAKRATSMARNCTAESGASERRPVVELLWVMAVVKRCCGCKNYRSQKLYKDFCDVKIFFQKMFEYHSDERMDF